MMESFVQKEKKVSLFYDHYYYETPPPLSGDSRTGLKILEVGASIQQCNAIVPPNDSALSEQPQHGLRDGLRKRCKTHRRDLLIC